MMKKFLKNLPKYKPDVLLLDIKMPLLDGIETTKAIRKTDQDLKIIIISVCDDEKYVIHLMDIGANGYLLKDAYPKKLKLPSSHRIRKRLLLQRICKQSTAKKTGA
jgi:DNA-binding NarL/FixJ family response regulator